MDAAGLLSGGRGGILAALKAMINRCTEGRSFAPERRWKIWALRACVRASLSLALAAGLAAGAEGKEKAEAAEKALPKLRIDASAVDRDGRLPASFAGVIKKAAPSVVNISASRTVSERGGRSGQDLRGLHPFFNDPMFREFFGEPGQRRPRKEKEQALGSGVVVSADGYILTSNHVIEGADDIRVEMQGGKEYTAKVVGMDPATDTAVLKVEAESLPGITLADSDQLEVGDVVLAIGNPFGLGQTVTMGIISATGRGELGITDYEDFIQTDASINMGNSGGALVDAQGRLIGINTAILSGTGGNQGVGFAIPINMGRSVMERLVQHGRVARGFLGVGLQPLDAELAERLGLKDQSGALVAGVEAGTPAAEAGLQAGDLIVQYNGKKVADQRQLRLMVSQTAPKTKVEFKVRRDGKEKDYHVTLAELPTERTLSSFLRPAEPRASVLAGVQLGDLDARSRREFSIPNHVDGALVTKVEPGSKAAEKGLRRGDVILEFEKKSVGSAEEAVELGNDFEGEKALVRVWSRGSAKYLFLEPAEPEDGSEPEKK